jgi:hypothetical protein
LSPEIEREYKQLIEEAEATFAARIRWSEDGVVLVAGRLEWRWIEKLKRLREQELTERVLVKTAGGTSW